MTGRLPRGAVVGILGGGQLGRMMAEAAAPLGYRVHVYAPGPGPASHVTDRATFAPYDDLEALAAFADAVDVVTYEFENVPADTAAFLAARVPVRPGPRALEVAQHRVREKAFLNDAGLATAPWRPAGSAAEVAAAVEALGAPCVLKTARGGYDGKGQTTVRGADDAARAWEAITVGRSGVQAIVEGFVDFAYEASVVVARGLDGTVAAFDLVENRHSDHVLHQTIVPADAPDAVRRAAREAAERVAEGLGYVGVLAVEFFVTADGRILANEIAPRPHNSGHWSIEGAVASQFEQAIRAVTGCPLGSPAIVAPCTMTNLLGDEIDDVDRWLRTPDAHLHLYGKGAPRPGRKMGHVTCFTPPRGG